MSAFFDQASLQHQAELDRAYENGFERGRRECDEHIMAECVDLRVRLEHHDAFESIALSVFAVISVIGTWSLIAWLVWG